jgi:RsiW-degrading membrane proteinase PrsW (M82 family)
MGSPILHALWYYRVMKSRIPVSQVVATAGGSSSLGDVADNLHGATGVFTNIFTDIFYIIGVMLVTAAIIKYRDHRMNQQETPLTRVLVLLFSGLVIGFGPFMVNHFGQHVSQYNV